MDLESQTRSYTIKLRNCLEQIYRLALLFAENNFGPFKHIVFVIVLFESQSKTLFRVLLACLYLQICIPYPLSSIGHYHGISIWSFLVICWRTAVLRAGSNVLNFWRWVSPSQVMWRIHYLVLFFTVVDGSELKEIQVSPWKSNTLPMRLTIYENVSCVQLTTRTV